MKTQSILVAAAVTGLSLVSAASPAQVAASAAVVPSSPTALHAGRNDVAFSSEGEAMKGHLFLPKTYNGTNKLPVVIVTGAWLTVKEQMPDLYAQRLADQGQATFTFDFRGFGESTGEPRQLESPVRKIQDIKNAISYLQTLPAVDPQRIGGLGICFSAGYMATVAAEDPRLKSWATVAAWLHNPTIVEQTFGKELVAKRYQIAQEAKELYERTGEVIRKPAYEKDNLEAAMSGPFDYYSSTKRGVIPAWTNSFAVMTWAEWQSFDPIRLAAQINKPTLIVHSDNSALPQAVKQFYAQIPGPKNLFWTTGQHVDFYDREPEISRASTALIDHFRKTL